MMHEIIGYCSLLFVTLYGMHANPYNIIDKNICQLAELCLFIMLKSISINQKLLQNVRKKHELNNKRDPHLSCRLWPRWLNLTTKCPTWVTRGIKVCSTDFVRISKDNRASFTWGPAILRQLKKVTYCWVKG